MAKDTTLEPLLTMEEVKAIIRKKGQGGLYNLIHDDPDFVTFKVGGTRVMDANDLRAWLDKQKEKGKVA